MEIKLDNLFQKMTLHKKGFWVSRDNLDSISYPEDGNELCAEIEDQSFWFNHRNNVIINGIKNFPPDGLIFDIGGGNGYVAKGLIDAGFDCALIEPGEKGAAKAVERGVKDVFCATVESIGFEEKSIPAVGLFDVIEHIEDDLDFLRSIRSLMINGGRLYATVPAYNLLWSKEDEFAGHFRRYTKNTISTVLEKAGFEIKYFSYFFRFLPPAIFALRTLPSMFSKPSSPTMDNYKKTHNAESNNSSKLLSRLLNSEINLINKGKQMAFGGSCFVVAKS